MTFFEYVPKSPLHHYSSVEAFRAIVNSKRIWLTDLSESNDPRELKFGYENFMSSLANCEAKSANPNVRLYASFIRNRLIPYYRNVRLYCLCFSLQHDSLPMWMAYADRYCGVSLAFRPTAFRMLPVRVQRVQYLEEGQLLFDFIEGMADNFSSQRNDLQRIQSITSAFTYITSVKHWTWAYEDEVRLIHAQAIPEPPNDYGGIFHNIAELEDGTIVKRSAPLQRQNRGRTALYKEFAFGRASGGRNDPSRAIEAVRLGPLCSLETKEVEDLMLSLGYQDFSVIRSECVVR